MVDLYSCQYSTGRTVSHLVQWVRTIVGEYNIDDVEGQSSRGKNAELSWIDAAHNEN